MNNSVRVVACGGDTYACMRVHVGFISVPLSRVPTTYSPGLPVYLSWWGSWEGKQSLQPRPHSQTRSRIGIAFGAGRKNEPPPPFNTISTLFPSSTLFRLVRGGSLCAVPKTAAVETTRTKGNSDTTAEPRTRTNQTPSPTSHHHQRQPFATPIYEQTSRETTTENRKTGCRTTLGGVATITRTASYVSLVRLGITRAPAGPMA